MTTSWRFEGRGKGLGEADGAPFCTDVCIVGARPLFACLRWPQLRLAPAIA
jgi:hypothetical protein